MNSPMTGQDMIDMFYRVIDDSSVDEDLVLDFLNLAKDELELERIWAWLIKHDTSLTWAVADTYLTTHSYSSLSVLFPIKVYVSDVLDALEEVPWEDREGFKTLTNYVMFDHTNKSIQFSGTTSVARTIDLVYQHDQGDITISDTPTGWPAKLHKMFVIKAADLYLGGTDADSITKIQDQKFIAEYYALRKHAVMLNARMRGRAKNYSSSTLKRDYSKYPTVIDDL